MRGLPRAKRAARRAAGPAASATGRSRARSITAAAGTRRIRVDGVLDSGRRLKAGGYRLSLVAVAAIGLCLAAQRAWFSLVA
jgi:hypothetical protein